jgi:hypothetical protein
MQISQKTFFTSPTSKCELNGQPVFAALSLRLVSIASCSRWLFGQVLPQGVPRCRTMHFHRTILPFNCCKRTRTLHQSRDNCCGGGYLCHSSVMIHHRTWSTGPNYACAAARASRGTSHSLVDCGSTSSLSDGSWLARSVWILASVC